MKILLAGKNGQVGRELEKILAGMGELIALDRQDLDLANMDSIREKFRRLKPDVIVNAAAYTAVDKAESEPDLAMAVNGIAPGIMAEEAGRLNALLVHYSTDYVFDGTKSSPYTEQDATNPLNVYGQTKLAGERAICANATRFLIFRTEWVYDAQGKNFLNTIKRLGSQRRELTIVNDQVGAPTWSREIAQATARCIGLYLACPEPARVNGIYNLTARGQTSWFGFAQAAAEYGLFSGLAHPPTLRAITSAEFPTPAKRPMYSVLSSAKLLGQFGFQLPSWDDSLHTCLRAGR
ncbi:MAG: dTDP-4-dehydrorhamnose reductase [Gallionellaceae bacterium]|nr:dTDP-4-dehydrorhamnose reductase [Gallionellaceae bacterium]